MNTITDYYDQPLSVGDRIIYPVGLGSSGVGVAEARIDLIEELVPEDANDPQCRWGTKYSERHRPFPERTRLELPLTWDPTIPNPRNKDWPGAYVYDKTKLFKLRVKGINKRTGEVATKATWIKNVQNVVRAPESAQ